MAKVKKTNTQVPEAGGIHSWTWQWPTTSWWVPWKGTHFFSVKRPDNKCHHCLNVRNVLKQEKQSTSTFELVTIGYTGQYFQMKHATCNLILSISWYQSESWLAGLAVTTKYALYLENMRANCCINVVAYDVIMFLLIATSFHSRLYNLFHFVICVTRLFAEVICVRLLKALFSAWNMNV